MKRIMLFTIVAIILAVLPEILPAQGTMDDYKLAMGLRDTLKNLALNIVDRVNWIEGTGRFSYRKTTRAGYEFDLVDAAALSKKPAFDHRRLADSLSKAAGVKYDPGNLPFSSITFIDSERAVEFELGDTLWRCGLGDYRCTRAGPAPRRYGEPPAGEQSPEDKAGKLSPDRRWEAFVRNYNLYIRSAKGSAKEEFPLSFEGTEGDSYTLASIAWSPDSRKLAVYRTHRGMHRMIDYIESSPTDQLQPKHSTREYPKPGDVLDVERPVLFDIATRKQFIVDNALFPEAYSMSDIAWWKDGRGFTFEYNQRGHQVYRIIEADTASGKARALVSEESPTFFCYYSKMYRFDVMDGREIIWMSERDGWNHLYLFDGVTGKVKRQITKGKWVVRAVDKVDEDKRQIIFRASGMVPGKDPYLIGSYRINFDGTALTALATGDANHRVSYSSDMSYYLDVWSRVDLPPVAELRRTADGKLLMEVEKADIGALLGRGWRPPEVFTAAGRDGTTDIWGIICRPMNFDPSKKYPVIEYIYAGPHDSFVPKTFSPYNSMQALAELGFIVVQIDGMGTSNRSKAFHDICWKNLADAGFPDRILWHKAVAARYPSYDITRVGIYGHSAGGQNAMAALLFHPEFYHAAVASCGCHDNRMDKISWNEQWMGWPLGPQYAACSNADNAYRLKGKLLLMVGEMDTNVDPSSTMQVVNALIKANKIFDLLVLPGQGHSWGGAYGERKRYDFFVHNLLGVEPPDWNVAKN